jgi:hypothetical protein
MPVLMLGKAMDATPCAAASFNAVPVGGVDDDIDIQLRDVGALGFENG